MINMKPIKAAPKGMADMYAFLDILQNADEYKAKLDALATQIARNEELVGIHDTIEKANAFLRDAQIANDEAATKLEQTKAECKQMRENVAYEYGQKRDEAIKLNLEAEDYIKRTKDQHAQARETLARAERSFAMRETALEEKETLLGKREAAVEQAEAEIAEKKAKMDAIFG